MAHQQALNDKEVQQFLWAVGDGRLAQAPADQAQSDQADASTAQAVVETGAAETGFVTEWQPALR